MKESPNTLVQFTLTTYMLRIYASEWENRQTLSHLLLLRRAFCRADYHRCELGIWNLSLANAKDNGRLNHLL